MTLGPIRLGPPLLYEGTYKFDKAALLKKCEEIAENTPGFSNIMQNIEIGDAGTSAAGQFQGSTKELVKQDGQPHTWPELAGFVKWMIAQVPQIVKDWEIPAEGIVITNSWVNRHRKGGWTNWHIHHGAKLCLAAYIQASNNSGHLLMVDPLENHWAGFPNDARRVNQNGGYRLPVSDNKVYFFAPFLRHGTEPNYSDQDRWVLSMNLDIKTKV